MAATEQPYDPYIPSGSSGAPGATGQNGNQRTAALQAVSQSSTVSWLLATLAIEKTHKYYVVDGACLLSC